MASYQFGVISTVTGAVGLLQSFSWNASGTEAVAQDNLGEVAAYTIYDKQATASIEVVFDTTTTLPDVGDVVTLAGVPEAGSYVVTGTGTTESNTAYKRASLTVKRWLSASLPAAVTT